MIDMNQKIFICAGDVSGEEHIAGLIEELKKINPGLMIFACGGERLKGRTNFVYDLVGLSVFGFWEPIKKIFLLRNILKKIIYPLLIKEKFDLIILADYYGFNVHIARRAKRLGIPVIYYISPQVWASRPGRIKVLARLINKMLVIFPFEEEIYRRAGIDVTWIGHPLLDRLPSGTGFQPVIKEHNFSDQEYLIGLFPGSRKGEIANHLPVMKEAARLIIKDFPKAWFIVFAASTAAKNLLDSYLTETDLPVSVVRDHNYSFRQMLDLSIVVSGTATLENACLGIPMLVIYRTNWLTYFLAKQLIKVPYISIVNILAGEKIVPEFIQNQASGQNLAELAVKWLKDPVETEKIRRRLVAIRKRLGSSGANRRAAEIINSFLGPRKIEQPDYSIKPEMKMFF